jgi:MoxR-like ATPase
MGLLKRVFNIYGGHVDKELEQEKIINVVGRQKEMEFLDNLFVSNEEMNILYVGNPAAGKTLLLRHIYRLFKKQSLWFDFTNTTGVGFIDLLIKNKLEREHTTSPVRRYFFGGSMSRDNILLLDEIDKIKPRADLNRLLDLLDGKEIHRVKHRIEDRIKFTGKMRVFATANSIDKLSGPFLSRFLVWPLRDYTQEEYIEVGRRLADLYLAEPNTEIRSEIATTFAIKMYEQRNTKDLRQLSHYMKLWSVYRNGRGHAKTVDEIMDLIDPVKQQEDEK